MPVPSSLNDLSTTPSLNSPAGSESPALIDDYLRTQAAFIKQVSDSKDTLDAANVKLTGNQTIAGTKTFSSAPVVPGLNGGQLAGMRNKIINGKMEIAQRGTSFAAAVSGSFTLDRWQYANGSAAVSTITQQADAPSNNEFQSSLRVAITTADTSIAAGDFMFIQQIVEGYNVRDLIGKTFTLSFWVRSSKTGTHCVALKNNGGDRSYIAEYTVIAANTWEQKSITVSGGLLTAGTWNWTNGKGLVLAWVMACGSTFQTTSGAWQTGDYYATSSQVNCLDTIGNIFAITGVQLEVGSVATPFEHRPYGAEWELCRYYYRLVNLTGSQFSNTGASGYGLISMRTTPSFTILSSNIDGLGAPTGVSVVNTSGTTNNYVRAQISFNAVGAVGYPVTITGTLNAEL